MFLLTIQSEVAVRRSASARQTQERIGFGAADHYKIVMICEGNFLIFLRGAF